MNRFCAVLDCDLPVAATTDVLGSTEVGMCAKHIQEISAAHVAEIERLREACSRVSAKVAIDFVKDVRNG